jgi:hypothetical protein
MRLVALTLIAAIVSIGGCSQVPRISVELVVPEGDSTGVSTRSFIVLVLEEDLPLDNGPGLIATDPLMPGRLWVDGNKVMFEPSQSWEPDTTYTVTYGHPRVQEVSWSFTTGSLGDDPSTAGPPGASAIGPFGQVIGLRWLREGRLAAIIRDQGTEAVISVGADGTQEVVFETDVHTFYMVEPLADGLGLVYSNLENGKVWHVRPGGEPEPVSTGLIFKVSPDRQRGVVYDDQAGHVHIIDFQSGLSTGLPRVPAYEFPYTGLDSSWCPGGRYLLYQTSEAQGDSAVEVVDTTSWSLMSRFFQPGARMIYPEWSPSGKHYAFLVVDEPTALPENGGQMDLPFGQRLAVASLEGEVSYYRPDSGLIVGSPVWSPDGRRVAFAITAGQMPGGYFPQSEVHVLNLGGVPQEVRGVPTEGYARPVCFSQDGSYLLLSVYVAQGAQARDISFLTAMDGKPAARLGEIGEAAWVDDERLVVWFLERQQGIDLWLVDAWGGFLEPLSAEGWHSQGFTLSPERFGLAHIAYRPGPEADEFIVLGEIP